MARRRDAKRLSNPAAGADGIAGLFVVAVADANPVALLVSALTLRSQSPSASMNLTIVASGARVDVVVQVADLLRARNIQVELKQVPGFRTWAAREAAIETSCAQAPASPIARRVIDISGASPEMALRLCDIARRSWGSNAIEVVSYEAGRNSLRSFGMSGDDSAGRELPAIDIGGSNTGHSKAVSVKEFLRLFGFRVRRDDPYGFSQTDLAARAHLHEAAVGLLSASRDERTRYRALRQFLAGLAGATPVEVDAARFSRTIGTSFEHLSQIGIVNRVPGSPHYILAPPWDRGAAFFLRGGWLEILVAEALQEGLGDEHAVELNTGTTWGAGGLLETTYAEVDAVFLRRNRLYVVSCKNEHDPDRLWAHLDRLRALVAEYGEAWVRPVLVSTKPIEGLMLTRCRHYEIGCVSGAKLEDCLDADSRPQATPGRLLSALMEDASRIPAPG